MRTSVPKVLRLLVVLVPAENATYIRPEGLGARS
jgi:hypothetical protein